MLTRKQLKQLKSEIVLNSLFLKDYSNTLYISEKTVYNFFEAYIENLYDIAASDDFNSKDIIDILEKYDNIDNLYNYRSLLMILYENLHQIRYLKSLGYNRINLYLQLV